MEMDGKTSFLAAPDIYLGKFSKMIAHYLVQFSIRRLCQRSLHGSLGIIKIDTLVLLCLLACLLANPT